MPISPNVLVYPVTQFLLAFHAGLLPGGHKTPIGHATDLYNPVDGMTPEGRTPPCFVELDTSLHLVSIFYHCVINEFLTSTLRWRFFFSPF